MDKNQSIGLIILAAFIIGYMYFLAPSPDTQPTENQQTEQTQETEQQNQDSGKSEVTKTENQTDTVSTAIPDSLRNQQLAEEYGAFAGGAEGEGQRYTLENEQVRIEFSNKGGLVKKVVLKEYLDHHKDTLVLLNEESSDIGLTVNTSNGPINLSELYFSQNTEFVKKQDTLGISFKLGLANGKEISHTYYLPKNSYQLIQENDYDALQGIVVDNNISINWDNNLRRQESDLEYNRDYANIKYYDSFGDLEEVGQRSDELKEATFTTPIKWISFKQRFFTTGLIANGSFQAGKTSSFVNPDDTIHVKNTSLQLQLPLDYFDGQKAYSFKYYFGPNKFNVLKKVTDEFEENIELGWPVIRWINRYLIITVFNFLENHIGSYGIIIIILVLIIRLILSPLTYKSHIQMAKTRVLKPELDEIKAKHGDDMQKVQGEQMKLYQKVGVNPLSGCVPLLLQMPILFAMFQFIPHAIELRNEPFLWADDLSVYDSIAHLPFNIPFYGDHVSLFTLLMTFSTILITWSNSSMTAASMQGPMKTMQYMMPLIFMFVLNSFPAGLTFYYFVSNIVSFGQITLMKRFVNEEKIRKILDENKKKNVNKKKSKFQMRLEEAMKASQEAKKKGKK